MIASKFVERSFSKFDSIKMSVPMNEELSVIREPKAALPKTPELAHEELQLVEGKPKITIGTSCPLPPLCSRIALEHNYAKLVPFRSSHGSGGKDSSFSTIVLFPDRVKTKLKKRRKKQLKSVKGKAGLEGVQGVSGSNPGDVSNEEGDSTLSSATLPLAVGEVESAGGGDVSR